MNEVARYYDYTLPFYKLFWHGATHALHYGIWDTTTKTHAEALINSNRTLAQRARITNADTVLDAGCGVGGSSLWLAKHTGAHVTGITVSSRQCEKAQELAMREGLASKTHFLVRDYLDTKFPSESFTVVWGLESLCYAHDRVDALATELYRVLKPGGRLVVADGFLGKSGNLSEHERRLVRIFEDGFVLPPMTTPEAFSVALGRAGFKNIEVTDVTAYILPTARRMWRLCFWTYPLAVLLAYLRFVPELLRKNHRTAIVQRELFEKRSLVYCVLYAEK